MGEIIENAKAKNTRMYIFEAITIALMFAGYFIHGGHLPDYGWKVLFVFIGLLFGWSTVGLITPSLFGLLALGMAGDKTTVLQMWSSGFGNNVICLIILWSVISKWLEDVGLVSTIMDWFLTRKGLAGKPWLFISALFAVLYLMGFMVGMFPAIFIGWAMIFNLCNAIGEEKKSRLTGFLMVNVVAISAMGDNCKPWSAWALPGFSAFESAGVGGSIDFLGFIVWSCAVYFVSIALMLVVGKFLLRIDASKLANADVSKLANEIDVTKDQKFAIIFMIVVIALLLVPSYLPAGPIKTILNTQWSTAGITVAAVAVLGLFLKANGKRLFDFAAMAAKNAIPWNPILLLTVTVPLGSALRSEDAGVIQIITSVIHANLGGMEPFMFYCATALILGILTQFCHNLVLLTAVSPIFITVAASLGFSAELVCCIAIVVLAASLGTPAASTRAGMLFGMSDHIKIQDCYLFGWLSSATMILGCLIVGVPLGFLL